MHIHTHTGAGEWHSDLGLNFASGTSPQTRPGLGL